MKILTDAIATLSRAEAYLLPVVLPSKAPDVRKGEDWKKLNFGLGSALKHLARGDSYRLGLRPSTLDLCVVDVDIDPAILPVEKVTELLGPPLAAINSSSKEKWHLYYRKPKGLVGDLRWADPTTRKKAGDIRCSKGYIVLWDPAAVAEILPLIESSERVDLSPLPIYKKHLETMATADPGDRSNTQNSETFQHPEDADELAELAQSRGQTASEVEATKRSALQGVLDAELLDVQRLHRLTPPGYAEVLLDAEAENILLVHYADKQGAERNKPLVLQEATGIWRQSPDELSQRVCKMLDLEIEQQYGERILKQDKILRATVRLREKPDRVVDALGIAWYRFKATANPRLEAVTRAALTDLDRDGRFLGLLQRDCRPHDRGTADRRRSEAPPGHPGDGHPVPS